YRVPVSSRACDRRRAHWPVRPLSLVPSAETSRRILELVALQAKYFRTSTSKPQNSRDLHVGGGGFILIFLPGYSLPRFGGGFLSGSGTNPRDPNGFGAEDGNPSANIKLHDRPSPARQEGGAFSAMARRAERVRPRAYLCFALPLVFS